MLEMLKSQKMVLLKKVHIMQNVVHQIWQILCRAYVETGFEGYIRPDHGRMIWGEQGKPGYGLYDRALGAMYLGGIIDALKGKIKQ